MVTNRPIRILHVVGCMNRGGVETWLVNVLRHVAREELQIDVLVHAAGTGAYDEEAKLLGARVLRCPFTHNPVCYVRTFKRLVREYGPYDIVHSHVAMYSGIVVQVARLAGIHRSIAHIYSPTGFRTRDLRSAYRHAMTVLLRYGATAFLFDSEVAMRSFQEVTGLAAANGAVLYPAVDLSPFRTGVDREAVRDKLGLPLDIPIVLYVARFFPHKNHKVFLEIADRVNQHVRAQFVMVGSHGPLLDTLEREAQRREWVSMITGLESVAELEQACDLFLFPSLDEGFGIVAIEAQAAGLPVIATHLESVKEALAPELCSLTFDPLDAASGAAIVERLVTDGPLRVQLAEAGRRWVERYDVGRMVNDLACFYRRIALENRCATEV